jgi:hypothetical protein
MASYTFLFEYTLKTRAPLSESVPSTQDGLTPPDNLAALSTAFKSLSTHHPFKTYDGMYVPGVRTEEGVIFIK